MTSFQYNGNRNKGKKPVDVWFQEVFHGLGFMGIKFDVFDFYSQKDVIAPYLVNSSDALYQLLVSSL